MTAAALRPSPTVYARVGGTLYLVVFALGFTLFAYPNLHATADATSAIQSVSASEAWLHLVSGAELLNFVLDVPLALIFYVLLAPVDRNIALLAAFFRLGNAFLGAIIGLGRIAVLELLGNPAYRSAFAPNQLQALGTLGLRLHGYGLDICFVFFGIHCILLGTLIFASGYLPKALGVMLAIGGLCYLADSFADIAVPAFVARIPLSVFLPGFIAELSLCLWLLAKGVDLRRWQEKTQRSGGGQAAPASG